MTQENHLKAILKKYVKNRFKNTKRFSLSDLRRKRGPEDEKARSPIDRRRVGGITKRPDNSWDKQYGAKPCKAL